MFFRNATVCFGLLAAMGLVRIARADGPSLPPDCVGDQTFALIHVNGNIDPASVKAAATALLGEQAKLNQDDLDKFQAKHDAMIKAGAKSVTIVGDSPADASGRKKPITAVYVETTEGADDAAIEKTATQDMPADRQANVTWSRSGSYLVMRQSDDPAPGAPNAERAKMFTEALALMSDRPVQVVMTFANRNKANLAGMTKNMPPQIQPVVTKIMESKYLAAGLTFGDNPNLKVVIAAADADGAKVISDGLTQGQAQLHQAAQQMQAAGGPAQMMGSMYDGLASLLTNTVNGSNVELNIDTATIKPIAAQFRSMMMMARGLRGGPPADDNGDNGPPPDGGMQGQ